MGREEQSETTLRSSQGWPTESLRSSAERLEAGAKRGLTTATRPRAPSQHVASCCRDSKTHLETQTLL